MHVHSEWSSKSRRIKGKFLWGHWSLSFDGLSIKGFVGVLITGDGATDQRCRNCEISVWFTVSLVNLRVILWMILGLAAYKFTENKRDETLIWNVSTVANSNLPSFSICSNSRFFSAFSCLNFLNSDVN